jgi:hypothetical protein
MENLTLNLPQVNWVSQRTGEMVFSWILILKKEIMQTTTTHSKSSHNCSKNRKKEQNGSACPDLKWVWQNHGELSWFCKSYSLELEQNHDAMPPWFWQIKCKVIISFKVRNINSIYPYWPMFYSIIIIIIIWESSIPPISHSSTFSRFNNYLIHHRISYISMHT